jgi:hypothetical protein
MSAVSQILDGERVAQTGEAQMSRFLNAGDMMRTQTGKAKVTETGMAIINEHAVQHICREKTSVSW